MLATQSKTKKLISLACIFGLTVLTGCISQPNRFGIVFISDNGVTHASDIYRMHDNTQNKIEQLTFTPTIGEYNPLVSKNGDKIIFEAGYTNLSEESSELAIEKQEHVYLLNTTSKELEDITDIFSLPPIETPMQVTDWSSDQNQFAVITYEGGLEFMDFDGMNKKVVPVSTVDEIPSVIHGAKWSPDRKKLALIRRVIGLDQKLQNPGNALLVFDLEGGKITQLADYKEGCTLLKWSPTSQQIVATCSHLYPYTDIPGPDTVRIFSAENPGQPYERIAFSPCYNPSWSPDGKQIVFACDKAIDQAGLFIINSDGSGIYEVLLGDLGNPAILKNPTWSPDGTQIVYVAGSDYGHTKIYSVNPDGSNNYPLTDQEAFYSIVSVYPLP